MKFYLFRHGQSVDDSLGYISGHSNYSKLTDLGAEQSRSIAERLKDKNIDTVISSPLMRAIETATICNSALKRSFKPILLDYNFVESNVGEIQNMKYEEVMQKFGDKYAKWESNDPEYMDVCFEGGESKRQIRERVLESMKYFANSEYENIAVSTHRTVIEQILMEIGCEFPPIENGMIVCLENTGKEYNPVFKGII